MTRTTTRALALGAGLLLALLTGARAVPTARADPEPKIDATLREFYRTGKWIIYIDNDVQKKAHIYHSRRAGAFLITQTKYGKPILIQPRERKVSSVPADAVKERSDDGRDIVEDAEIKELGTFRMDGGDVAIDLDGLVARLQPQPILLGEHEAADLLLHTPEYKRGMRAYRPDESDVKALRHESRKVEVLVFFGSWCPTCARLVPRILRVQKELGDSHVSLTYYGLPHGAAMRRDKEAHRYGIHAIPTGVVTIDGKPAGQISSRAFSHPERALRQALGD
jgi:thiol-disulfide isomerase/thioredoxin